MAVTFVAPVLYGVAKSTWSDGFEAVADRYPVISERDVVAFLRGALNFEAVRLAEFGQAIDLLGNDGDGTAFRSHPLRRLAECQAEIFWHAS